MTYDFTSIIDRTGHDAIALDRPAGGHFFAPGRSLRPGFDIIPMWVADMNFAAPRCLTDAIAARLAHPCFGYFDPRDELYQAIIDWQRARFGATDLTRDMLGFENGVLAGVVAALNVFCTRGEKVLVHAPTYIGFTHTLEDNGYHIVLSDLVRDGDGVWRMDFDAMEEAIVREHIHAAIFCSPHNPTGRVWERWELERFMELCRRHDVYVVCDAIWADLALGDNRFIPISSVSDDAAMRSVELYAPSKTFSIAGIPGSYHVCRNPLIADRIGRELSVTHATLMDVLWMHAMIGGFSPEGAAWVDELREVIQTNVDLAMATFEQVDGVEVARPQGTYMLFPDFTGWCEAHGVSLDELLQRGFEVGVFWQDGRPFHGACSIRMNLALPTVRLREALDRLLAHVLA